MNIAIIGGGFTGLTAAYELAKKGHKVTVFEKDKVLGGLAHGFKRPGWDWHLEYAYHHLFANDWAILSLIRELGLEDKLILTRPITANYISPSVIARSPAKGGATWQSLGLSEILHAREIATPAERSRNDIKTIVQLDSPIHLLRYPGLSIIDKVRTAALVAFCKVNPFWQPLEGITARQLFEVIGGATAWQKLWESLMIGKFGNLADTVAASWLWARIKKRTPKLYYIKGGFHTLVAALEKAIKQHGGKILANTAIIKLDQLVKFGQFDRILLTVPTPIAAKLIPNLAFGIGHLALKIPHLHAQTLILETKEPILKEVYWLNITDRSFPFLAVVAHTNMIDKKHYGGRHLTYFGNYLPDGHPYLSMTKNQLFKVFLPYVKRLNPAFHWSDWLNWSDLFIGLYAQPVHQLHYSSRAPKLETPVKGVYLANLDSIYPWDRGTNYAVELGIRAAKKIGEDAKESF
ncbi:FAD-dependent oxidoreductase [Candidatus Gottesmanbacteria bacterium]|nr:FAD-dependent oxidoreductase [Candidatus Gottesmanbacteria bacterium]